MKKTPFFLFVNLLFINSSSYAQTTIPEMLGNAGPASSQPLTYEKYVTGTQTITDVVGMGMQRFPIGLTHGAPISATDPTYLWQDGYDYYTKKCDLVIMIH
jgi:hypothetical protein